MLKYLSIPEVLEILQKFTFAPEPIRFEKIIPSEVCGDIEDAQDIAVQICMTNILLYGATQVIAAVPKQMLKASFEKLTHFFIYVTEIMDMGNYSMVQAGTIKPTAADVFKEAISKNLIHPIFANSLRDKILISNANIRDDKYARFIPSNPIVDYTARGGDTLFDYVRAFDCEALISIPCVIRESDVEKNDFVNRCVSSGYEVHLAGNMDENDNLISAGVAIITT